MAVTQAQIAQAVGVSQTVVSDVLHGHLRGRVRPETKQRIIDTARQMGYHPNAMAQALRNRQSRQIVYLSIHEESAEFPILHEAELAAIAQVAREQGFRLLIEIAEDARSLSEMISAGACDGAIVRVFRGSDALWTELREIIVPYVVIGQCPHPAITSVAHDAPALIRSAVANLRSLGHERVGLIVAPVHDVYHDLLTATWRIVGDPTCCTETADREQAFHVAADWLTQPDGPTAIVTEGAAATAGAVAAIVRCHRATDLHVIGDVGVAFVLEQGAWASVLDSGAVGTRAASELLAMLSGREHVQGPIRLEAPITHERLSALGANKS